MPDIFDSIAKLINSPPGQLAAGGVLAGIVWKFFERVEAVLPDITKFEIAVWLVGRKKVGPRLNSWTETFANIFDRVFGVKHLSWRCFRRSCYGSFFSLLLVFALDAVFHPGLPVPVELSNTYRASILSLVLWNPKLLIPLLGTSVISNFIPDYISLLESRYVLTVMRRTGSLVRACLLAVDLVATVLISLIAGSIGLFAYSVAFFGHTFDVQGNLVLFTFDHAIVGPRIYWPPWWLPYLISQNGILWICPAFFTSIWLWLHAGSGFLLKAARRFDIGFDWFNRKFDIEKKPLQSIGLVAGTLVALVYWMAVIVSRVF